MRYLSSFIFSSLLILILTFSTNAQVPQHSSLGIVGSEIGTNTPDYFSQAADAGPNFIRFFLFPLKSSYRFKKTIQDAHSHGARLKKSLFY